MLSRTIIRVFKHTDGIIFCVYLRKSVFSLTLPEKVIEHIHSIDYYHIEDEHGHKHEYRAHERKKADPDERYNRRRFYRGGCWGLSPIALP